jgi:TolB amino-terminal domain.
VKPKPPAPTPTEDTADAPDKTPAKPAKEKPKQTQKDSKSEEFDPNEMAALLNKVDPSGGGGRESDKDASLGSENRTGPVAEMSQSELDALTAAVTACFNPPVGAEGVDQMVVPLRVTFTIDGDLAGPPEIKSVPDRSRRPGGRRGRRARRPALRALSVPAERQVRQLAGREHEFHPAVVLLTRRASRSCRTVASPDRGRSGTSVWEHLRMRKLVRTLFAAFTALAALAAAAPSNAEITININGGNVQPLPIAIPNFVGSGDTPPSASRWPASLPPTCSAPACSRS